MNVTKRDLAEFAFWIKGKKINPKLKKEFKSDKEYEDFMMEAMQKDMSNTQFSELIKQEQFFNQLAKDLGTDVENLIVSPDMVTKISHVLESNPDMDYKDFVATDEVEALIEQFKQDKTFSEREKVSADDLKKAKEEGVVQKKPNGKWGIISIQAKEWWKPDYDTKANAEAALAAYHANKWESINPGIVQKLDEELNNENKNMTNKRTFSIASSKRWRIKTKEGRVLAERFLSEDAANEFIKNNKDGNDLTGAKVFQIGSCKSFSQKSFSEDYLVTFAPLKGNMKVGYVQVMTQSSYDKKVSDPGNYQEYKIVARTNSNEEAKKKAAEYRSKNEIISPSAYFNKIGRTFSSTQKEFSDGPVTVDDDPTILKNKSDEDIVNSALNSGKPKDTVINFDNGKPFFMSVEPWISADVINDLSDGIYAGTIKGDKISAGDKIIEMSIKLNQEYPDEVIAVIKGKKVYIWKLKSLLRHDSAKIFSVIEKELEEDKKEIQNGQVGKTTVEIEKEFSVASDEEFIKACHKMAKDILGDAYNEKVTEETAQGVLKDQEGDYDTKLGIFRNGLKGFSKNFSDSQPTEYGFEIAPGDLAYDMDHIIGSVLFSVTYAHLFHLIQRGYAAHIALDEYYEDMPEKIDALAEAYLAETNIAKFVCCITPGTVNPVDYFIALKNFLTEYPEEKKGELKSNFQSMIDDIVNLLESTIYKLKRLDSGNKNFSFNFLKKAQKVFKDMSSDYLADLAYSLIMDERDLQKVFKGYSGKSPAELSKYIERYKITPADFIQAMYSIWQYRTK